MEVTVGIGQALGLTSRSPSAWPPRRPFARITLAQHPFRVPACLLRFLPFTLKFFPVTFPFEKVERDETTEVYKRVLRGRRVEVRRTQKGKARGKMEVTVGIEPTNNGFANRAISHSGTSPRNWPVS